MDDVNLALVSGRLALAPDFEWLPDGSRRARLLVCVHPIGRGRFDVLPVVVPGELHSDVLKIAHGGTRVLVAGPLMRRCSLECWEDAGRIELIADAISFPDLESLVDRPPSHPVDEGIDVEDSTRSR